MEDRDRSSLDTDAATDETDKAALGENDKKSPAIGKADLTHYKVNNDDFAEEFPPELPNISSAPSADLPSASLPFKLNKSHNYDLASRAGRKILEHASAVEPALPHSRQMAESSESRDVVMENHHDVIPGAFAVAPSPNMATTAISNASSYVSSRAFADEESKQEEEALNSSLADSSAHNRSRINESDLYAVEAHRVPDEGDEERMIVAEAEYVQVKWYQRPLYRWILLGSVLFAFVLLGVVVVLVVVMVRPSTSANPSSSSVQAEQIACNFLSRPNLTECRATTKFDSLHDPNNIDITNGSTIPSELGVLTKLTYLDFAENALSGTIPSSLGGLTKMTALSFYNNQMTGTIPSSLANLTKLERLFFRGNKLTGSIPPSLSSLTKLSVLSFWDNKLTGSIPSSLSSLSIVTWLSFSTNKLTGSIPSSFSGLTLLTGLHFFSNQLTGPIPSSLSSLTLLTGLSLYDNSLSGTIPTSLCSHINTLALVIDCGEIACDSGCCTNDNNQTCG